MSDEVKGDEPFPVLDASDPDFAQKFRDALGLRPGEKLQITGPQFDRTDGRIVSPPQLPWDALPRLSRETLKEMGLGRWSEDDETPEIWLYPAEWYGLIPAGHRVIDICGEWETFQPGVTDDDRRFGLLAYGLSRLSDGEG